MGQLAFGIAGAVIGFAIGGPMGSAVMGAQLGFLAGTLIGSLVDPPKMQGPRLEDIKVRGADYGTMRPILYGAMRIGGLGAGQGSTVNGLNKFTEHEEKSSGKGGPEQTNYRYTLSFFNEICEGPIYGVARRWVNGRLMTSEETETSENWPYKLYLGTNDQMPDPTMEVVYGVGEVNPMRGVAYESVEEKDVTDIGNARPNVEYEAFTKPGPIPRRINTFRAWQQPAGVANFYRTFTAWWDKDTQTISVGSFDPSSNYYHTKYRIDGTLVGEYAVIQNNEPGMFVFGTFSNSRHAYLMGGGLVWYDHWEYTGLPDTGEIAIGPDGGTVGWSHGVQVGDYLYGTGSPPVGVSVSVVQRVHSPDGIPTLLDGVSYFALDAGYSRSTVYYGSSDDGFVYVSAGGKLWKLNADLTLVHFWPHANLVGTTFGDYGHRGNFFVYKNMLCFKFWNGAYFEIGLTYLDPVTFLASNIGISIPTTDADSGQGLFPLYGCLFMDENGIYSLCGGPAAVNLGDIVYDLCIRAGLTDEQIDTSDLTQEVRGFVIASQMTAHNAIDTLRRGWFFDADDSDGVLRFKNRGGASIATIPDDDLGAHEIGSEKPELLEITRINEEELPRRVWCKFYDFDHDYQPGSVPWGRTATHAKAETTIDLPIVFTMDEALSICQWHMYFAWLERERYVFFTSRKWVKLTKTDVVTARGVKMRITNRTESPNGLLRFEAVRAHAGPYAPIDGAIPGEAGGSPPAGQPGSGGGPGGGTGEPGSGGGPGGQTPPSNNNAATQLVLLDIPLAAATPFGFHAAMGRFSTNLWPGAALYKSADGGVTYTLIASTFAPNIIAYVQSGVLATYGAGDTLDPTVVTVNLSDPVGLTLESCTDAALAAGANACAIRNSTGFWELAQYRDVTLVSTGTYELSNWLRGRKGTSTGGHAISDTVVMLPVVQVDGLESEIGVERLYKAVTFGTAIADALPVAFTNTGLATDAFFGTAAGNLPVTPKPITGTTYTILSSDRGKLLTFGDPAGVAVTLPPGGLGFPSGWYVYVQNAGVGNVVITTSATIDGVSSLTLKTGEGTMLASDGTNYTTMRGVAPAIHIGDIIFDEDVDVNSHKIINLDDPTNPQDAATKAYTDAGDAASIAHADALVAGLDIKASCRAASISNLVLSAPQIVDGVSIVAGERVLVKDQSTAAENGIYVCAAGAWARASDANVSAEVTSGMFAFVTEGTVNGDKGFVLITNDPIILGTTALTFTQFSATAPLTISGTGFAFVTSGTIDGAAKTATDATALLDAVVGDAGSGGIKGLVPAPAAGDAAAGKFLSAAGTYLIPSGVGASSAMIVIAPAYAATLTIDLATYVTYPTVVVNVGVLTGPITFDIVNGFDGQVIRATFTQDGTGGRVFTAGAHLSFSDDLPAIALTTAASKSDETSWRWHGASSKARATAINKGFA